MALDLQDLRIVREIIAELGLSEFEAADFRRQVEHLLATNPDAKSRFGEAPGDKFLR